MSRLIDVLIAALVLIVLSPIFLITYIAIYISDPGPVFYFAKRAGIHGIEFQMIKFRSMRITKGTESRITSRNDNRIFPVGRIIRFLKIDELPQLVNIIRGDMAIIGPRPEDISIVNDHYDSLLRESLLVRPGLASPGSIFNYTHLEREISEDGSEEYYLRKILPLKVKMDVVYARNKSVLYDISLALRTAKIILLKSFGKTSFPYPPEYYSAKDL